MTVHLSASLLQAEFNAYMCGIFSGGSLLCYTGAQQTDAGNADTGTLIATLPLGTPAFNPASQSGASANIAINGTPSATNVANGDIGHVRLVASGDLGTTNSTDPRLSLAVASASTLNGGVNSSVTTFTLASTASFPTAGSGFVGNEQFSWTSKTSTTLTGITRGINSTSAAAHANGVAVTIAGEVTFDAVTITTGQTITCTGLTLVRNG
jgi:hypothetical protein